MDAGDGDRQLVKLGVAAQLLEICERSVDRDRSGERRVSGKGRDVRHTKKSADVELGELDASLRCVAASQFCLALEVQVRSLQLGGRIICKVVAGGVRRNLECAESLTPQCESVNGGAGVQPRIVERARAGDVDRELAGRLIDCAGRSSAMRAMSIAEP